MIPKKNRLTSSRVQHIVKKGLRQNSEYFNIKFLRGAAKENRFAVMVSIKIASKAVERNKIRRQIYECVRVNHLKSDHPLDIVVITKPNIRVISFTELQENITKTLQKIHE